jgi:hypothetical protein
MLTDVHSHFFKYPDHFSQYFCEQTRSRAPRVKLNVTYEEYCATAAACGKTIVFGGKAKRAGLWVPDEEVANYVNQHQEKLLGFLSVDPTQLGWRDELQHGHEDLKLKGIKLMPMYASFFPNQSSLDYLWQYATHHHLPVLVHTGTTFIANAPLEYTLPRYIDAVAIRFPEVKIIMAHLSHPYEGECVATLRKHSNVFADCSALHFRPFQLYLALMLVQEYGVWEKVMFGSDYPFTTVQGTLDGMRSLNSMLEGTALPRLDMSNMEELFQRDSLELLELEE